MNMAQLWKLPIIFVVENNKWAIGMAHDRATSDPEIWRKASSFGMAVKKSMEWTFLPCARSSGPLSGPEPEKAPPCWNVLPIASEVTPWQTLTNCGRRKKNSSGPAGSAKALERDLTEAGLVSSDELRAIEKEIDGIVQDCVDFALSAPEPDPSELTRYIWAED